MQPKLTPVQEGRYDAYLSCMGPGREPLPMARWALLDMELQGIQARKAALTRREQQICEAMAGGVHA